MNINKLLRVVISTIVGFLLCATLFISSARANNQLTTHLTETTATQAMNDADLSPTVLKYAVNGYEWALVHDRVSNPNILTIINFNEPSYQKRLWVINLKDDRVLMHMHVAQGKNTGAIYAKHFSNQPGSRESSPGVFTTQDIYDGKHGESLRVNGLEAGINNNAFSRAIVIHPAWYMTPSFIRQNGYAGRSWGCFAVNPAHADKFISVIKGGSVIFAYASPEIHDPRVDHALSYNGRRIFDSITDVTHHENPIVRFFASL